MELSFIKEQIIVIRGQKVMLDSTLAALYQTETKRLKEAVRRNRSRFPEDFMFQLNKKEFENLRTQFASSSLHGGTRYLPFVFTEQGIAMLSSVLNSEKAIAVNIAIVRAFVLLRQHLLDYKDLKDQIAQLEKEMNRKFQDVNQVLHYLMTKNKHNIEKHTRKRIGFKK